jgi:8-oxo-dGTP pyrophosphatase MutT (NUDIX family)
MTGDGTDQTPKPEDRGDAPRRRRRRRRGRKRSQGSSGTQATSLPGGDPTEGRAGNVDQGGRSKADDSTADRAKGARSKGTQPKGGARGTGGRKPRRRPAKGHKKGSGSGANAKLPWTREVSAGGVVYRRTDDGIEVVLASRRTRRGDLAWGLAKGGIEDGETREEAAIREVREETGLTAAIEADLGDTKYMYVWDDVRIRKTVHFFLMRFTGGDVDDRDDEMEEIRWFPLERALKRAAYRGERDVLRRAADLLS